MLSTDLLAYIFDLSAGGHQAHRVMSVEMTLHSDEDCANNIQPYDETMICAGNLEEGGVDTCQVRALNGVVWDIWGCGMCGGMWVVGLCGGVEYGAACEGWGCAEVWSMGRHVRGVCHCKSASVEDFVKLVVLRTQYMCLSSVVGYLFPQNTKENHKYNCVFSILRMC